MTKHNRKNTQQTAVAFANDYNFSIADLVQLRDSAAHIEDKESVDMFEESIKIRRSNLSSFKKVNGKIVFDILPDPNRPKLHAMKPYLRTKKSNILEF